MATDGTEKVAEIELAMRIFIDSGSANGNEQMRRRCKNLLPKILNAHRAIHLAGITPEALAKDGECVAKAMRALERLRNRAVEMSAENNSDGLVSAQYPRELADIAATALSACGLERSES